MNRSLYLFFGLMLLMLLSCRDEKPRPNTPQPGTKRLYVLNEGLFNMNNSTLTVFDIENRVALTDYFEQINGRRLGDTGNDMGIYGSKLYVVITGSSQVEVLEASSGKSIRQIPLFDEQRARQPRAITFLGNKAFVACFDGMVVAIDTTTLQITGMVRAGSNPDGIVASGEKLYVSNSGGLNFPTYDSTVSVIDPVHLVELRKIRVGVNPGSIATDGTGEVYVVSRGNYGSVASSIAVINTSTDAVKLTIPLPASSLFIYGDTAFITHIDYNSAVQSRIALLSVSTELILAEEFITDAKRPETVYGIYYDRSRGLVFVADARSFVNTGKVLCYNTSGKLQFSFETGLNPSKMAGW